MAGTASSPRGAGDGGEGLASAEGVGKTMVRTARLMGARNGDSELGGGSVTASSTANLRGAFPVHR